MADIASGHSLSVQLSKEDASRYGAASLMLQSGITAPFDSPMNSLPLAPRPDHVTGAKKKFEIIPTGSDVRLFHGHLIELDTQLAIVHPESYRRAFQ